MRRTLYWKRLLIVLAVLVAFGGAVFAVHRVQVKSQVVVFKEAAERAEAEIAGDAGRRGEVIALYAKYLKFRPADEAAYRRYAALLFEQTAADPDPKAVAQTTAGIEAFLRAFPRHPDERRRLAELYAKGGRHQSARQHIGMLLDAGGDAKSDPELLATAAECDWALSKRAEAVDLLDRAVGTGTASVAVYKRALEYNHALTREVGGNQQARQRIDKYLGELAPPKGSGGRFLNDRAARVAAIRFRLFEGAPPETVKADVDHALAIPGAQDDPDVLLAAAEAELAHIKTLADAPPRLGGAEKYLRAARARDPKNVGVGALLAEVLVRQGHRDEGVAVLRDTGKLLAAVDSDYAVLADRLLDLGEQEQSAAMVDVVAADPARRLLTGYFRGRQAVLKQDWLTALRLLEEAAPNVVRVGPFYKKAMVGVAACYAAIGNPDRQLEYCRRALAVDPDFPPAILGEAEVLARTRDKRREALRGYRKLVHQFQMLGYRAPLARLEMYDVLTGPSPGDKAAWVRFREALGFKAPADEPEPAEVAALPGELQVVYADALAVRGQAAAAADGLRKWLAKNPKDPQAGAVFVALSGVSGATGTAEAALAVLDDAKAKLGDVVELRLARARLYVARGKVPSAAEFDALAADAGGFPEADRFRLWAGVGEAAGRAADLQPADADRARELRDAALRHLRAAADLMPRDLMCRAALLDHGLAAGRADVVAQARREMAAIEGESGPMGALSQIAVELPAVRKMTGAAQAEAAARLRGLAKLARDARPEWGRAYLALAELDDIAGPKGAALDHYLAAIDKGERQDYVVRRAVELYRDRKQDDKAVALLNRLRADVRLPDDLERYRAIRDLLAAPELPRNSKATVDAIAPAASTDYRVQLLRGALLAAIRDDGALAAFRRAVELNDRSAETWGALVGQLARAGELAEARKAVAQAQKALTAAPPAAPEAKVELDLALAGLHEAVGDLKAAQAGYEAAAAAAPHGLNAVRQRILFHQRTGTPPAADGLLAAAAESPAADVARWARRHLALTLAAGGQAYHHRGRALELIERNLAAGPDDEDVKARAVIRTVDPATRAEGVAELKKAGDRGDLTPDEWYLLGRLAFDVGQFDEARGHFQQAARVRPGVTAEHIAALVRVELARAKPGELSRAEAALERLKVNNPASWEAAREEARLLARKAKDKAAFAEPGEAKRLLAQAVAAVKAFPGWDAPDATVFRTGPLLEELGLTADAEALYQKFLAASPDPGAHQPLAILYIRQKQVQKAIDLAFEREPKAPPLLTARVLTGAVRARRPGAAVEAKIEAWLDAALAKAAGNAELEAALIGAKAELADARGEYAAAVREYRRAVAAFDRVREPRGNKDYVVNNLCMLLALRQKEDGQADDAVKMMTELIDVRGPVPAFLDTRAVAYLVSSRPEQAIKDLELALVQYDRGTYHFHLAWSYDLLEAKRTLAAGELKTARAMGLTADDLHPIEYENYQLLLKKHKLPPEKGPE